MLFRRAGGSIKVLLGLPGGPFWHNKDLGSWSIPKGLIAEREAPLAAARREFAEETGYKPHGKFLPLGAAKQPGEKIVHAWALEDNWDVALLQSNMFQMEWPPKSGRTQSFPELDRAAWFDLTQARAKILKGQVVFLDRLLQALEAGDRSV